AAKPAWIVEDDPSQRRQPLLEGKDLVDLLLILGDDHGDFGVVEHMDELARDRILVGGHGGAAESLGGELRPIETRTIVADDRELVAAAKSERGEAEREIAHVVEIGLPAVGSPDPAVLLADARGLAERLGVAPHELRQRAGTGLLGEPAGHALVPR